MSHAIAICEYVGWLGPDETINIKVLSAHVACLEAEILCEIEEYEEEAKTPYPYPVERPARGVTHVQSDALNYYWFGGIEVGTPRKDFVVHFDTGSSDLFLPSAGCGSCDGHTLWDPSLSSTANSLGQSFRLSFGGGDTVEGLQFTDVVILAGFTASTQALGAALKYSTGLQHPTYPADGLLGMGFRDGSRLRASPLIKTLAAEGKMDEPVFSFRLTSPGGELFVGGTNPEHFTGSFTYSPVIRPPLPFFPTKWQVTLEKIQVNGQTVVENVLAHIDTGTALVLGSPEQVESLYNGTGGRLVSDKHIGFYYYAFPYDSFPSISFTFGGTTFPIPRSALKLGKAPDSSDYISGLAGHRAAQSYWLVGAVFLQSVYTTFDLGVDGVRGPRIGFAELA